MLGMRGMSWLRQMRRRKTKRKKETEEEGPIQVKFVMQTREHLGNGLDGMDQTVGNGTFFFLS